MYYGTLYIKVENKNVLKFYTNVSKDEQWRDPDTTKKSEGDLIIRFEDSENLKEVLIDLYVALYKHKVCVRNEEYAEVSQDKYVVRRGTLSAEAGPVLIEFSGMKDKCKLSLTPFFVGDEQVLYFSDTGKKPITDYLQRSLEEVFNVKRAELRQIFRERSRDVE